MKRIISILLAVILLTGTASASGDVLDFQDAAVVDVSIFEEDRVETLAELNLPVPTAILMEKETGTVLYEKNADEVREPASVTKIMTILLIVEAIESGALSLDDMIRTSAYAASMGGSQVYLEEGETFTLRDMLKSIVVASANDAAVAVAEHICGTEEMFVSKMNRRAQELGMENTRFKNCTGLLDDREHVTTARDVAIMSRELIGHDLIKEYTTIWTDSIRDGEFGLTNTNKLIHYYDGATGLKTGFTSRAGYCLSATAMRDGVEYIAVVLGGDSSTDRFEAAKTLLGCGFASYTVLHPEPPEPLPAVRVKLGELDYVNLTLGEAEPLLLEKGKAAGVTATVELPEELSAPVSCGQQVGTMTVKCGDEVLGKYPIVSEAASDRLTMWDIFSRLLQITFLSGCQAGDKDL